MNKILKELQVFETSIYHGGGTSGFSVLPDTMASTSSFHTATHKQPHRYTSQSERKLPTCAYCKGAHSPNTCSTITKPEERVSFVKENHLCFNCLAHHKVSQCTSTYRCRKCSRKHHTSLCTTNTYPARGSHNTEAPKDENKKASTDTTASLMTSSNPVQPAKSCLLKTAIAPITFENTTIESNILFDEGSQRSFILQDIAQKLGLQSHARESISLTSFGAEKPSYRTLDKATVSVQTITGHKIPKSALPLPNPMRMPLKQFTHLKGLHLAHPITENENFEISVLIGADHYWHFVEDRVIRGNGPTAVQSKLGYLLSGPLPSATHVSTTLVHIFHVSATSTDTTCHLEKFWQVESAGVTTPLQKTTDQQFLKSYIDSCVTPQPDGSYSVKFPWKPEHPQLPSNYSVCEKRTRGLVRRLAADPSLLQTYGQIISEQLERGFIEKVTTASKKAHYIPHHPIKKQSSITPIRIVYDCCCCLSPSHPSLNDCLMAGPPFLNDMCSILIRFHVHKYGFSTDIEKAFLHVTLNESERDFTRFLWLSDHKDPHSKLQAYRFKVVLFGSVSSPFMLYAALNHHLASNLSPVSEDIQANLYVDNVISGCHPEEAAIQYYNSARTIMAKAKFNLRSWASNSTQLQTTAKQDGVAESGHIVKILGLQWNIHSDTLFLASRNIYPSKPKEMSYKILPVYLTHLDSYLQSLFKQRSSFKNYGGSKYTGMNRLMMT